MINNNTQTKTKTTWRKVKLGEVVDINKRSIDRNFSLKEIEYIDISSVKEGNLFGTTKYNFSEAPGRARRLLLTGDTIISTVRPENKSFYYIKEPKDNWVASTGFAILSPKENTDPRFIYYLVTRKKFIDYLASNTKGSAYPAIGIDLIGEAEVLIPDLPEQKKISDLISAFDDKIELNNKINQNLEQTAQMIFKEWFVKFRFPGHKKVKMIDSELGKIPEGWRVSSIGEELETILGGTPSTNNKEYWDKGNIPWINSGALNDFPLIKTTAFITELGLKNSAAKLMPTKTTVLPMVVSIGKPVSISILAVESSGNQSVVGIIGNDKISPEYIYFWIKFKKKEIYGNITGGAQQHINKNVVDSTMILTPDDKIMNLFDKIAKSMMDSIINNSLENQKLTSLRDLLLQKLMGGEILVKSK